MKRVLLIEDLSCYGKCSIAVALPIFAVAGIEAIPLPTAIFSAHTGVGSPPHLVDFGETMEGFFLHFQELFLSFDAVLVGYSLAERQLEHIGRIIDSLKEREVPLVLVDPAMADHGKLYGKLSEIYPKKMKELVKRADIITPNLTEALILAERDHTKRNLNKKEIESLLFSLNEKYHKKIVITGIQTEEEILVAGISEDKFYEVKTPRIAKNYSGTGDVFAGLFLSDYVKNQNFGQAMKRAAELTSLAVRNSMKEGMRYLYFESILKDIQ